MCPIHSQTPWYKYKLSTREHQTQVYVKTEYDSSFRIKASRLWNLLPKYINSVKKLDLFKVALGRYLKGFPDTPPVPNYSAVNRNSLLDSSHEKGVHT